MPRCPVCKTLTEMIRYEGVPVHNCGTCGGYWITDAKLATILARREVVMPEPVKQKMLEIAAESNSTDKLYCMTCGRQMVKEQFRHWGDIQLDRCPKCDGLWLDRGELEKCQIYWEYVQDHPESEEARRAAKLAELDTRWATRKQRLKAKLNRVAGQGLGLQPDDDALAGLLSLDEDLDPGPSGLT